MIKLKPNYQVFAYGVMMLRGGLFHSDPHPGNLLAQTAGYHAAEDGEQELKVVMLDFGQVGTQTRSFAGPAEHLHLFKTCFP